MPEPYVAYCAGEFIESAATLQALLALLAEVQEPPPCREDIACWHKGRLACVRHPDGTLTVPRPRPVPVA